MRLLILFAGCLVFVVGGSLARADEPKKLTLKEIEAAETQFREVIITRAANFEDEAQAIAISIVAQMELSDFRFDDPIRKVFESAVSSTEWDADEIQRACDLLDHSTISKAEATEFVFDCYLQRDAVWDAMTNDQKRSSQGRRVSTIKRTFEQRLRAQPEETAQLLAARMKKESYPASLLELLSMVPQHGDLLLPLVLKAGTSEDPEIAEPALRISRVMIGILKEEHERQNQPSPARTAANSVAANSIVNSQASKRIAIAASEVEEKYVRYSERIIGRYDGNKNQALDPEEAKKMLMDPFDAGADVNGNGEITAVEYAGWMQSRSSRKSP